MNFMLHTMLDAACDVLRVHYKSMKCDVSLSQGSVSAIFTSGGHLFHTRVKKFFLPTTVQTIIIIDRERFCRSYDYKCTAIFFLVHSVDM